MAENESPNEGTSEIFRAYTGLDNLEENADGVETLPEVKLEPTGDEPKDADPKPEPKKAPAKKAPAKKKGK